MIKFEAHAEALAEYNRLLDVEELPALDARARGVAARCAEALHDQKLCFAEVVASIAMNLTLALNVLKAGNVGDAAERVREQAGVCLQTLAIFNGAKVEQLPVDEAERPN